MEKKKKEKNAKKRKVASESASVNQMKDASVRTKAGSMVKQVKQFQRMTTYGTAELQDACPACDSILIIRDEIVVQPDTKPQGLQQRKEHHFALLLPEYIQASPDKKKELGKYFIELGKCLQNPTKTETKRKVTCTNQESKFLECVYGKPCKKSRST